MPRPDRHLRPIRFATTCTRAVAVMVGAGSCLFFAPDARALAQSMGEGKQASRPATPSPAERGATRMRAVHEAMGGTGWRELRSYLSTARIRSAVGEMRVSYSFVAPDSHRLLQTIPGGDVSMEMGYAGGVGWMGESGRMQRVDPKVASEMARGGDIVMLLRSLDERFEDFRVDGVEKLDEAIVERVSMRPRGASADAPRWLLLVDPVTNLPQGLEIPAPAGTPAEDVDSRSQSLRFVRWEPVTRDESADAVVRATRKPLLAPRGFTATSGGVRSECEFESIAVDTLAAGSIQAPAGLVATPR